MVDETYLMRLILKRMYIVYKLLIFLFYCSVLVAEDHMLDK